MVKGEGLKVKGTRVNGQEQRVFDCARTDNGSIVG